MSKELETELQQKSYICAIHIEQIKAHLQCLDIEHLKQTVKDMNSTANNSDALAVLNRNYNPDKSKLLRHQAIAITKLLEFRETLIYCDTIKQAIKERDKFDNEINSILG